MVAQNEWKFAKHWWFFFVVSLCFSQHR